MPDLQKLPREARIDVVDWLSALRARLVRRCKPSPPSPLAAMARRAERIVQAPGTVAERRRRLDQLRARALKDLGRRGAAEMEGAAVTWVFKVATRHLERPSGLHVSLLPTLSRRHNQTIAQKKRQAPRIWDDVLRRRRPARADYEFRRELGLDVESLSSSPHRAAAKVVQALQEDLKVRWNRTIWRCQHPRCDVAGGRFFSGARGARKSCDRCAAQSSRSARYRTRLEQQQPIRRAVLKAEDRLRKQQLSRAQASRIRSALRKLLASFEQGDLTDAEVLSAIADQFLGLPRPGRRWGAALKAPKS